MLREQPSKSALFGALIAEELARLGVVHVVLAPGSRSAPLVAGVVAEARLTCHLVVDERAAGYLAVGLARATGRPAAVITTSGTATANLLPAIVEADHDAVPLLVLSADRPPELRGSGANQTIRQVGLFGTSVRWEAELPCPDDEAPARFVLTTIDHAHARTLSPSPGPVHVNCPFREPLSPDPKAWDPVCLSGTERWERGDAPFTTATTAAERGVDARAYAAIVRRARQGLVVAGTLSDPRDREAVAALAEQLAWPLLADIRSGLRHGLAPPALRPHLDRFLDGSLGAGAPRFEPDVVLQFGGRPTGRRLVAATSALAAEAVIVVDPSPDRLDPGHRATHRVMADAHSFGVALRRALGDERPERRPFLDPAVERAHGRVTEAIAATIESGSALTEPFVARYVSRHLAADEPLFVSSSMPIRDLDGFAAAGGPSFPIGANRGASGIDGVLASAIGFALGHGRNATLLIGDLALLHDLGSLFLLRHASPRLRVIVLNNGGGAIFSFLPIARHPRLFTPWFDAAHDARFEGVSRDMGIAYARVESRDAFVNAFERANGAKRSVLIEVASSIEANRRVHDEIDAAVRGASAEPRG